jgi:hypothetical protein
MCVLAHNLSNCVNYVYMCRECAVVYFMCVQRMCICSEYVRLIRAVVHNMNTMLCVLYVRTCVTFLHKFCTGMKVAKTLRKNVKREYEIQYMYMCLIILG